MKVIETIDWKLLRYQKCVLQNLVNGNCTGVGEADAINGVINLIESIQGRAVGEMGYDAKEVFG